MKYRISFVLLLSALALTAPPSVSATNSPIELKTLLQQLVSTLPGEYDNAAQTFFETESGFGRELIHPRGHVAIVAVDAPAVGEHVIVVTMHRGSKAVSRDKRETLVWTLSIDKERRAVRMAAQRFKDPARPVAAAGDAKALKGILPIDLEPDEGASACTIWWRLVGMQLQGVTERNACMRKAAQSREKLNWDWQWVLTPGQLWIDYAARTATGRVITATPGETHLRFTRTREFDCLLGYRPPDGPPVTLNGARMNDGGDTLIWEPKTKTPRKFYYELVRGMWPSSSGKNYEDLLRIYMYEGDPDAAAASNRLLGVGWASAASDRASFGDGVYSGRCKLFDPLAPPAKND